MDPLPGAHAIIQPLNENYSFDAENEAGGQKSGQNEDSETTQKTAQKTTQKTTQIILDAISNNPNVTRLELSEICGITADGVKWQLRNLTKSGRIARIGGDCGGHWEVRDKYSQPFFYISVCLRPCLKNHLTQEKERYASF